MGRTTITMCGGLYSNYLVVWTTGREKENNMKKRNIGVWVFLLSIFIVIVLLFIKGKDCWHDCQANYSILSVAILMIGWLAWAYCDDKEKERTT